MLREIKLNTKEFLKQKYVKEEIIRRYNYDPDTGVLVFAERGNPWFDSNFAGKEPGHKWTDKDGYKCWTLNISLRGRTVRVVIGRVIWLIQTGEWPEYTIDHINRDSYDNRWSNLRDVPSAINTVNRGHYKGTKNKFRGVDHFKRGNKYQCRITHQKKVYNLGYYDTEVEAAKAYDAKAKELFGEHATLNFPLDN